MIQDPGNRSLLLLGAGACLGLALAGYSLFTARGTSTLHVPSEDVALVNQQPISRVDYLVQLKTLFGVNLREATAEQRRKVLDDMIREEIFVQRGKELDLVSVDADARTALVNAVDMEVAADALTAQPTDGQLRSYYAAHASRYAAEGIITVYDFVSSERAPDRAPAALALLGASEVTANTLAGLNFKASAKSSVDEFYFAAKIHLGDVLFALASALSDREFSAPVDLPDGLHILYVVKNTKPKPLTFAEARDQVQNDYRQDAIARSQSAEAQFLRRRANVRIADDLR